MFYSLVDAQGIGTVVNIGNSFFSLISLLATTPAQAPFPTPTLEVSTFVLEVDQLAHVAAILTMKKPTLPSVSTKKTRNEEQRSPQIEVSPKQTRLDEGNAFGEVTPFIKILDIFSSRLPHTIEEAITNLSFFRDLKEDKMELISQSSIFKADTIFSLCFFYVRLFKPKVFNYKI